MHLGCMIEMKCVFTYIYRLVSLFKGISTFVSYLMPKSSLYNSRRCNGVMVIVAGIGHSDTSSNPGLIAFHIALIPLGKV